MNNLEQKKKEIVEEFKTTRTLAITRMFDDVDEDGIYPTTKFFNTIDEAFTTALSQIEQATIESGKKAWVIGNVISYEKPTYESPFFDAEEVIVFSPKSVTEEQLSK